MGRSLSPWVREGRPSGGDPRARRPACVAFKPTAGAGPREWEIIVTLSALAGEQRRVGNPALPAVRSTTSDRSGEQTGLPSLCALVLRAAGALAAIAMVCAPHTGLAQSSGPTPQPDPVPITPEQAGQVTIEQWAIHGQTTYTQQLQPAFPLALSRARKACRRTPTGGKRSTPPLSRVPSMAGAEIWFNPEVDQGFGLSNTFGVAGYLSGEAYKLGQADPYFRMARGILPPDDRLRRRDRKARSRPQSARRHPDREPHRLHHRQVLSRRHLRHQQIRARPAQRLPELGDYRRRCIRLRC